MPEHHNYYCSYDGQGNVAQVSNMAGDMPYNLYAYDSYGTQTGSDYSNDSFSSYKGYDKGPFGYKTGVRQYDPETGRFLSPDTFKGYITDPASQHPYMYCHGNPISYSDPSGYDKIYIGMYSPPHLGSNKSFLELEKWIKDNGHTYNGVNINPTKEQIDEARKANDIMILFAHGALIDEQGVFSAFGNQHNGVKITNIDLFQKTKTGETSLKLLILLSCDTGENPGQWRAAFHLKKNSSMLMNKGSIILPNAPGVAKQYLDNYLNKKLSPRKAFDNLNSVMGVKPVYNGP